MKIYLAGPMTNIEHYNFPEFNRVAKLLRDAGHEVFNPAENDVKNGFDAVKLDLKGTEIADHGFSLRKALKEDLSWICDHAEAVAVLPGWADSRGARTEVALAHALGIPAADHWAFWHQEVSA